MKLKKGDTVIVTIGKDEGKKGKVDRLFPKSAKVQVNGLNMFKRHLKKRDEKNPGGIIDITKPLHVSVVALVCPSCGKQTRVGYVETRGEKIRVCRKCHQKI